MSTSSELSASPGLADPEDAGPARRRRSVGVHIGSGNAAVLAGGAAPIAVQSMPNTDTADVEGTAAQVAALARAGSELVRITVDRDVAAAAVPPLKGGPPKRGTHGAGGGRLP